MVFWPKEGYFGRNKVFRLIPIERNLTDTVSADISADIYRPKPKCFDFRSVTYVSQLIHFLQEESATPSEQLEQKRRRACCGGAATALGLLFFGLLVVGGALALTQSG